MTLNPCESEKNETFEARVILRIPSFIFALQKTKRHKHPACFITLWCNNDSKCWIFLEGRLKTWCVCVVADESVQELAVELVQLGFISEVGVGPLHHTQH